MSSAVVTSAAVPQAATTPAARAPLGHLGLSLCLLGCCAVAVLLGLAAGSPAAAQRADPELARLLRGMALLKAGLVAGGVALLGWRLRFPIPRGLLCGYLCAISACAGASALIWQLSRFGVAAALFHGGLLALLVLAWRDTQDHPGLSLRRRGRP